MAKPAVYNPNVGVYDPEAVDAGLPIATGPVGSVAATAPAPTGKIVGVITPDGKTIGVDEAHVQEALAQGYTLESPEQKAVRAYVEEHKGLDGTAIVALDKFADEATFGVLGAAMDATDDPLQRAQREALYDDHKIAAAAGTVGGFGASFLYGGELFKGASAGGKAVEGAILGEKLAGEAVGKTLAGFAPAGSEAAVAALGPSFARKMIASGAGTAVEGMVLSAPKAFTEAALGDPNQAAETLLYGAGAGGLLGLAGPVASKLKSIATKGVGIGGAIGAEKALATTGKSAIGEMADMQAFRSLASNQASLNIAVQRAEKLGGAAGIGETLNELGLVRRVGENLEAYEARLAAAKNGWGSKIGELAKALDTYGATPDTVKIFDRIKAEVVDPLRKNPGFEEIEAGVQKYLDSFASKAVATEGGMSFERLHEIRASLDDLVYRQAKAKSITVEELRKVRGILEDEFTKQGDAAARAMGEEFAPAWAEAKKTYGRLSAADAAAKDYAFVRDPKNRIFSPTDNGWGIAGGIAGILTGGPIGGVLSSVASTVGHHLLRTEGNGILARGLYAFEQRGINSIGGIEGIRSAMAHSADQLDKIPSVFADMSKGYLGKSIESGLETKEVHALTSFTSNKADGTHFSKLADALAELTSDPAKMQSKLAEMTEPYAKEAPQIAQAYAAKLTEAMAYLESKRPKAPTVDTPFMKTQWAPTDQAKQTYGRIVETVLQPFSVLDRLRDKSLGMPEMDALKAVYPRLYDAMRKRIFEFGMSGKAKELDYAHRLKLSLLLDAPIDPSMEHMDAYQATFQTPEPNMPPGGGGSAPIRGIMKGPDLGTDVQRISAK